MIYTGPNGRLADEVVYITDADVLYLVESMNDLLT